MIEVVVYCRCNGCDEQGTLKRISKLVIVPRCGDELDGLTVRKVRHSSITELPTVFISNTENIVNYPDSSRPLGRKMMQKYGYVVCDDDEWIQAYYA